ncbi:MAG TPA: hypothetical protein VGS80_26920 [Ktedonobacterales bacterium]|nr:hypothetical protein [Ktedonobacterales bacterium]
MTDLEMLRLHVEAGWYVRLPDLAPGDVECRPDSSAPPWKLYVARVGADEVRCWRTGLPEGERAALVKMAYRALSLSPEVVAEPDVKREVALRQVVPAVITLQGASRVARRLGLEDRALVEAFEPGESGYYLDAPERAPVFGAFAGDRLASVAHSSRRTALACELGVDTLASARRQGFGLAVTVLWAAAVAAEGLEPIYSARVDNTASLALARAAGYRAFAQAAYIHA